MYHILYYGLILCFLPEEELASRVKLSQDASFSGDLIITLGKRGVEGPKTETLVLLGAYK